VIRREGRFWGIGVAVAVAVACWLNAPAAHAGADLEPFPNCAISAPSTTQLECDAEAIGLANLQRIAMSPDGKNLYAIGHEFSASGGGGSTLVTMTRDPVTGALTSRGCMSAEPPGGIPECSHPSPSFYFNGGDLLVSPDGRFVFVISPYHAHALKRDADTGDLTYVNCVDRSAADIVPCDGTNPGLAFVEDAAISPDGKHIYAAGRDGGSIAILSVDQTTGALSSEGCIADSDAPGPSSPLCAEAAPGLQGVAAVAVSGDGESVYAGSPDTGGATDLSLVAFERDPADGSLTFSECIEQDPGSGAGECATDVTALQPITLEWNGDSNILYAGLARFARDPDGGLTPIDCLPASASCPTRTGRFDLAYSSEGPALFRADEIPVSVGGYSVNQTDDGHLHPCCSATTGVPQSGMYRGPGSVVVARNGDVYVAAGSVGAIIRLRRIAPASPETYIEGSSPSGFDSTPTFEFSASLPGASFECRIQPEPFGPCSGPGNSHTPAEPLPPTGNAQFHRFEVRATGSGQADPSPVEVGFSVRELRVSLDRVPDYTNETALEFAFAANWAGATLACQLDGGTPFACGQGEGTHTAVGLEEGEHTFVVTASEPGGTIATASKTFTVDLSDPQTQITKGPSGRTSDATPTFKFGAEDPAPASTARRGGNFQFECSVDGRAFKRCESPETLKKLATGKHTFAVRAIDKAGNPDPSPAKASFKVTR
jgi:hypothetical protein